MGYKTPGETYAALEKAGARKVLDLPWTKTFTQGFLAGLYVGLGATASIMVAGGLYCEDGHPNKNGEYDSLALQKLLYGSVFPVGLLMVLFTGAELITSNIMVDGLELIHRFSWITLRGVAKNAIISWCGNFAGALFCCYFLSWHAELFASDPWHIFAMKIAVKKYKLKPYQVFLRGIGCNTLVCIAVYLAYAADDVIGKFVNMWFPIMAFAAIGYEHCVANMFLLPHALLYGVQELEPRIGWGWIFENILMATLGNLVGAIIMVDLFFWYGFGRGHLRANPLQWDFKAIKKIQLKRQAADWRPKPLGVQRPGDDDVKRPTYDEIIASGAVAPGLAAYTRDSALLVQGANGSMYRLAEGPNSGSCIMLMDDDMEAGVQAAAINGRKTCRYTKRYVRKDGRIIRVTINASVDHDAEGHPTELQASVFDAENPGPPGMLTVGVDREGHASTIRTVDDAFCRLLGYTPEELKDRPLLAVTHPDDYAVSDDAIHHVESEATGLLSRPSASRDRPPADARFSAIPAVRM